MELGYEETHLFEAKRACTHQLLINLDVNSDWAKPADEGTCTCCASFADKKRKAMMQK